MKHGDNTSKLEDTLRVKRVRRRVSVENFDNVEWNGAEVARLTRYWSGAFAPASRHAEARMMWSDDGLLVRFVCRQDEPLIVNPAPQIRKKTMGLWDRDVCEIFIAPDAKELNHYLEFEVAPTGEWLDLEIHQTSHGRETNWDFRSGMTAAAHIVDGFVRTSLCVPWEAFGRAPAVGSDEVWRANLFRCVGTGERRGYVAWQPTRTEVPSFHVPEVFGALHFSD